MDLTLILYDQPPFPGTTYKRRDRLLKACLLPNWRIRRTGPTQMEDEKHLVLDRPCSWLCFVSSSVCMSLPLMRMSDRQCAVACLCRVPGGDPPDPGTQRMGRLPLVPKKRVHQPPLADLC